MRSPVDVLVVGAGLAGLAASARLAQLGRSVLLVEREDGPRYRPFEALAPAVVARLAALGFSRALDAAPAVRGARFLVHDARTRRVASRRVDEGDGVRALHLPRAALDARLFAALDARAVGALRGWTARDVLRDERGRVEGLRFEDPRGRLEALRATLVLDASGRDALCTARFGEVMADEGAAARGLFVAHLAGPWGGYEGDEALRASAPDASGELLVFAHGWAQRTPLGAGACAVLLSCTERWTRGRAPGEAHDAFVLRTLRDAGPWAERVAALRVLAPARALGAHGALATRAAGPGWLAAGESALRPDPVLGAVPAAAVWSGVRAAECADRVLAGGDEAREGAAYAERLSAWFARHRRVTRALSEGALLERLVLPERALDANELAAQRALLRGELFEPDAGERLDRELAHLG